MDQKSSNYAGLGIILGAAIGTFFEISYGFTGIYIATGAALGLLAGSFIAKAMHRSEQ